jgi:hypothetical protein
MKEVYSSVMLEIAYYGAWWHNLGDHNMKLCDHRNLRSHIGFFSSFAWEEVSQGIRELFDLIKATYWFPSFPLNVNLRRHFSVISVFYHRMIQWMMNDPLQWFGIYHNLIEITGFVWSDWRNSLVSIASVPVEFWTENFFNQMVYSLDSLSAVK